MRNIYFILSVFIVLSISLIGCSNEKGKDIENVLSIPNKIVIYKNGTTIDVENTRKEYKSIFELTNSRFHDKMSTAQDSIDDSSIEYMKKDGIGVEFIYNAEQTMEVKGEGFKPFTYYKLYFQLDSKKSGNAQGSSVHTLCHGDKDNYKEYSRGPLKYSEELVSIVTKF